MSSLRATFLKVLKRISLLKELFSSTVNQEKLLIELDENLMDIKDPP